MRQAQAATVLVNRYQDGESLVVLSSEPWVTGEDSTDHADWWVGSSPAPRCCCEAAAMTDAGIRYVPDGVLPEGVGIAALLRWPKGEQAP